MGFPVGCSELPSFFLHALFLLGSLRHLIVKLFYVVGLGDLLDFDSPWPDSPVHSQPKCRPAPSAQIEELLPMARFAELGHHADSCVVCLHEFDGGEEVRRLRNCGHVFHRCCIDPWVQLGQRGCPLCRTPLFSTETPQELDDRDRATGVYDSFFADFPSSPSLLSPHQPLSVYN